MDKFGGDGGRKVMEFIAKLLMFSDLKTILLSHGMKWGGMKRTWQRLKQIPCKWQRDQGWCILSYCCITNHHKLSSLKQFTLIASVSVGEEHERGSHGFSAQGLTRLQLRCCLGCVLIWKLDWGRICFRVHSSCWKNPFLCSCMTEDPSFLLDVSWRPPSGPRGHPQFSATGTSSVAVSS